MHLKYDAKNFYVSRIKRKFYVRDTQISTYSYKYFVDI